MGTLMSCGHGLWARFQDFTNDDPLMPLSKLGSSWREILLQQQKWWSGREGLLGLGQKGGIAAEYDCMHGKRKMREITSALGLVGFDERQRE